MSRESSPIGGEDQILNRMRGGGTSEGRGEGGKRWVTFPLLFMLVCIFKLKPFGNSNTTQGA